MSESTLTNGPRDLQLRREYWIEQMEEAWDFMLRSIEAPLQESLEPALDLTATIPPSLEVTYALDHPMSGDRPLFFMRSSLVPALIRVTEKLRNLSLGLRIEYAYRTPETQAQLCTSDEVLSRVIERVKWEADGSALPPELAYRRLIVLCANVYKFATHIAAAAVDVTVIDLETGEALDRGGPFLELSERTPMASPFISALGRRNRTLIRGIFAEEGFRAYPYEFWHFCAGDVYESVLTDYSHEARFGPVALDPATGRVTAIADPTSDIVPREAMVQRLAAALARIDRAQPSPPGAKRDRRGATR
jgi:zinc D-Ala-D-Ala dipeptidase